MTCRECGGRCCMFVTVPSDITVSVLKAQGAPLNRFIGSPSYLANHRGVHIERARVRLDPDVPVVKVGGLHLAAAPCRHLTRRGRCDDYERRPRECREFTDKTAWRFIVPAGCKYDNGTGVDVSCVVALSRMVMKGRERVTVGG